MLVRLPMLRQQEEQPDARPNLSLADFIAPRGSGVPDYVGMFAVTSGIGVDALVREYESDHDDYHAIMVKALADRFAEAFATMLHARAREDWGHPDPASLAPEDLHHERHRGIRPAFGYPACPDHSTKFDLFRALDAERQGITSHRIRGNAARGQRERAVLLASGGAIFQRRADRARPGHGLRRAQGCGHGRD